MKPTITIKNTELIQIYDGGKDSSVFTVLPLTPLMMAKKPSARYTEVAKELLDKLSMDWNNVGIDGVLSALLIEVLGNDNFGKNNK